MSRAAPERAHRVEQAAAVLAGGQHRATRCDQLVERAAILGVVQLAVVAARKKGRAECVRALIRTTDEDQLLVQPSPDSN